METSIEKARSKVGFDRGVIGVWYEWDRDQGLEIRDKVGNDTETSSEGRS
jgi:hypothetical protein